MTSSSSVIRRCALCDSALTNENDAQEHIILAAIGGRKKTRGFICVTCNSDTGKTWDAELAAQLNFLGIFVGIKRQKGINPPELVQTTSGTKYLLQADGSRTSATPSFKKTEQNGKVNIAIQARTLDEAKQMVSGIKRKYPGIDTEVILKSIQENYVYSDDPLQINLSIGGELAGRSIVKSCLALASHYGVAPTSFKAAINYLRNRGASPCFGYFYERDLILNRPSVPFHCVALRADPVSGFALGYVELYGAFRMICGLSNNYDGPPISKQYAVDPRSGEVILLNLVLDLTEADVLAAYRYEKIPDGSMQAAFGPILATGIKRDFDAERDRAISRAVDFGFKHCGAKEGDILSPEQIAKLTQVVTEQLMPFIQRFAVGRKSYKHT